MNRTMIRGVTAGVVGAALTLAASLTVPSIARGAEGDSRWTRETPVAEQLAAMDWHLPDASYLRHVHPRHHHHAHRSTRASRSSYRVALTGSPQTIAHALMLRQGWTESQWGCLDSLWTRESDWETYASNGGSGAYGIPQALPASKMASAGADWRTNPVTQIRWGLGYIASTYGSPCAAWQHSQSYGYY